MSELDQKIGARLRSIRIKAEMTQAEVGKKLGIAYAQIQKYEYGQNRVSLSTAVRLADILECKVIDFIPEHAGDVDGLHLWSARTISIATIVEELDDKDTRMVFQLAKRLAREQSAAPSV